MTAVTAMLDIVDEPLESQDTQDNNNYVLGRMGLHNVVIACLPAGVYGTNAAATVAGNMLRTFTGLRFGLLVGTGGGIPNTRARRDIRLGDIVVSQPEGTFGGVVQYDLGKNMGEGRFKRKGSLNSPPTLLLTALSTLQSKSGLRGCKVLDHLMEMNQNHPELKDKGYVSPGAHIDHLYCSQCEPSQWWWLFWLLLVWLCPLLRCEMCENGRVRRPPRNHETPVIHYGTIASGNEVIKDAKVRDQLGREFNAVCVEMEAAGLMNNFPCIVVRGICDYADSHKNDAWQNYAAAAAAAYARWFLGQVPLHQIAKEKPIQDVVGILAELALKEETRYRSSQDRDCHQAFKTSTYEDFKDLNPSRVDGTCQWVLSHLQYRQWYDEPHDDLLWISADPGCGKSVLAKSLVDNELRNTDEHTVCYFFFKDNEAQNNVATALCALLHQLFSHQRQLIQHAIPVWEKNGDKLVKEIRDLWRILLVAARDDQAHGVTCVLDALDECRPLDRRWLIEMLSQFHTQTSTSSSTTRRGRLKFLVTSRPYDNIQAEFQKTLHDVPIIRLRGEEENDSIHKEIDLVIRMSVEKLATDKTLDDDTKDRLMTRLLGMQHRTYLWLHLAIDEIYRTFHYCLRPEEASIESLPSTVEEAYEKILARVSQEQEQKDNVKKILQIVVGARRALTIQEMAIALGIATSAQPKFLDQVKLDPSRLEDNIRDWCGLFIFINHARIYLIHQTAKEFLIGNSCSTPLPGWKHCLDPREIEKEMTRICVEYLCLEDTRHVGESLAQRFIQYRTRYRTRYRDKYELSENLNDVESLLVYSAGYWPHHLRDADTPMNGNISQLYNTDGSLYDSWFTIFWDSTHGWDKQPKGMNSIHLAAFLGHGKVLRSILQSNGQYEIDKPDECGRTALIWASDSGHEKVVQILLNAGAEVNAQAQGVQDDNSNALSAASSRGNEKIVQILLDRGADINALGDYGTALSAVSARGNEKMIQILVDRGADVNAQGGVDGNALYVASERGHEKIVQILLDRGADINAFDDFFSTALSAASARGNEKIVQILLERGADVNSQGGYYGNALSAASARADVNALGKHGTALDVASKAGHEEIVQILLNAGADVNALGKHGTALDVASKAGHEKIVQILLNAGADVQAHRGNNAAETVTS
ncbi:hypothetical protein LTR25_003376 [Vermiconidia calcicola]|uniref:Ankyrin repeat protein n=1 Tax=Vermiconidia calcicola TaxID=1690605 RepID=A0AAV9QB93_9PEZI|nr:hypothetical protein LTR25_003376 [Vermiconidia calcicola]